MMDYNELYHYGVKGMKWGVRRDIGRRARAAGRTKMALDANEKKRMKMERKLVRKGSLSDRGTRKLERLRDTSAQLRKLHEAQTSSLNIADIHQGERAVRRMATAKKIGRGVGAAALGVMSFSALYSDPNGRALMRKGAEACGIQEVTKRSSKVIMGKYR